MRPIFNSLLEVTPDPLNLGGWFVAHAGMMVGAARRRSST